MKVVYCAGPISKGDIDTNIGQSNVAMITLMQHGFSVINPMLSCFAGWPECRGPKANAGDMGHEDWLRIDLAIVERCDVLLRLPGESVGADREMAHAMAHKIPVCFSVAEVIEYFQGA